MWSTMETDCARLCIKESLCKGYKQEKILGEGNGKQFVCDMLKETNSTTDPEMSRNVYLVPRRRDMFEPWQLMFLREMGKNV